MKYLVIDVGGSAIKYALMNKQAEIIESNQLATPTDSFTSRTTLEGLYQHYKEQIAGIAFSLCQGSSIVNRAAASREVCSLIMTTAPMFADIQSFCPLPVTIENDAKCATLAEAWKGTLTGYKNGIVVVLGSGVGGGIFLNGQLYKGSHFAAGELSFLLTDSWHCKGIPTITGGMMAVLAVYAGRLNISNICHQKKREWPSGLCLGQ